MKLSTTTILAFATASTSNAAFVPHHTSIKSSTSSSSPSLLKGYLDNLNSELYKEDDTPDVEADSRAANQMSKDQVDRYGPGNLNEYVDFEEFDGGDGQMGVAGDGQKGLDKSDFESTALASSMNNSRARSAKNAWGTTSSGYAQELIDKGVDTARAQQLENWAQQREISAVKKQQKFMTEQFDAIQETAEADWRTLSKFGVERNQEFDLNEEFGEASIEGGDLEGTIEVGAKPGTMGYHEIQLKNPYMGFADFRATFSPDTSSEWIVSPTEGSLTQREATIFNIKFKASVIGTSEGCLIIETEDFKKVWKLIGTTSGYN